jgi:hypothetical protein
VSDRIPDEHAMMIRLACGHARVVDRNLGGVMADQPGAITWCFECGIEVETDHAIAAELGR